MLFAVRDSRLLSCGRYDRTIVQWRCLVQELPEDTQTQEGSKEASVLSSWNTFTELPRIDAGVGLLHGGTPQHRVDPQEEPRLAWVRSVVPPSDPPPSQRTLCNAYLKDRKSTRLNSSH